MAKAVALHVGCGSSVERVWAKSVTGHWFSRFRRKDPRFGWGWSTWKLSEEPPPPGEWSQEHFDHGTLPYGSHCRPGGEQGLRLPF